MNYTDGADFEEDDTGSFLTPNNSMQGDEGLMLTDTDFYYNSNSGAPPTPGEGEHHAFQSHQSSTFFFSDPSATPSLHDFHPDPHSALYDPRFGQANTGASSSSSAAVGTRDEYDGQRVASTPMMDQDHSLSSSSSTSSSSPSSVNNGGNEEANVESAGEILNQLFEDLNRQKEFLERYREVVRTALLKPNLNLGDLKSLKQDHELVQFVARLQSQVTEIIGELKRRQEIIDQLESFYILLVDDLLRLDFLRSNFLLLLAQAELYSTELSYLQKSSIQKPFVLFKKEKKHL